MLWITIFIVCFYKSNAVYRGTTITCECTTPHCVQQNLRQCNTTGICFSQYLNRNDGSHPVSRGCIKTKTPLLCENRRPAVADRDWPLLLCCDSNLCNRDAVPTPPPWFGNSATSNETVSSTDNGTSDNSLASLSRKRPKSSIKLETSSTSELLSLDESPPLVGVPKTFKNGPALPHIISPIYISVLVLGVISLIIIGIVAAVVLKRNNRYDSDEYGALEHQHEQCLKHGISIIPYEQCRHVNCDCDSEVESLSQRSQSYVQVAYPNQETDDT